MNKQDKLNILRDILLTDERAYVTSIDRKIKNLEDTINKRMKLSEKVEPIIQDKLQDFVQEIPETLGPTITETLKTEIKNSRDEVVEALYPIMGKMIKKYIQNEISMLVDTINAKAKSTFSLKGIKNFFRSKVSGTSKGELMIKDSLKPEIEQIMVIEKGSGLLFSEFSQTKNIEQDMVAGMLTAIKSFAEDAFSKKDTSLQQIEYDLYTIHLQNFSSYYIAVVLSGPFNMAYRDVLEDKLLDFAQYKINKKDLSNQESFNAKLDQYFKNLELSL